MKAFERSGVRVSDVRTQKVKWLWRGRIPAAKLVILEGDPDIGKSLVVADLVSRVTTHGMMPDAACGLTGSVEMWCAEDDVEDTVRPRLEAANCDLTRVRYSNDFDEQRLRKRLAKNPDTILLVIDPWSALMMCSGMKSNDENDSRSMTQKLSKLATEFDITVLVIRHWNKSDSPKALYKGSGSIAITAAARATMMVGLLPGDDEVRVLASVKSNLAARPRSLKYMIVGGEDGPVVQWLGDTSLTANDLTEQTGERWTRVKQAAFYSKGLLARGELPSLEYEASMKSMGYSSRTLDRARVEAGVRSYQRDGKHFVRLANEAEEFTHLACKIPNRVVLPQLQDGGMGYLDTLVIGTA